MLRYPLGPFGLDCVDRSKESKMVVPRLSKPVVVQFRRDGDLTSVISAVRKNSRVTLNAGVSAGKSTRVPLALAEALGMLIVHTIPSPIAARYLASYVQTIGGDKVTYMDDIEADLPQRGVVIMTNTYFISRLFTDRFGETVPFTVYMDETHESDAATAVIRSIVSELSCVKHTVFATATSEPGMDLGTHMPGKRTELYYAPVPTKSWSAMDVGKPWSITSIEQNTVMFLERKETIASLASDYREHGFRVYVLESTTAYDYFLEAMTAVKNPNGPVTILIADYSYRTSITLSGVPNLIESGEVAVSNVSDGAPVVQYREAYDFEVQQACARIGRTDGEKPLIHKPKKVFPKRMCDLECLEGDAAALMFRMLGYRPPLTLSMFSEAIGSVPMDLVGALQGATPLRLYPAESREAWVCDGAKPVGNTVVSKNPYRFQPSVGVKPRPASCRTVRDTMVKNPSPPLNMSANVTHVPLEPYTGYAIAREESPTLSPIHTLSSRSVDNLSILTDEENPLYVKPRRIAKRVMEERQAREKEVSSESSNAMVVNDDAVQLADHVLQVKGQAGRAFDDLARNANEVKEKARLTTFHESPGQVEAVRRLMEDTDVVDATHTVPSEKVGEYMYYHGLDRAPAQSAMFVYGYDSVVEFCRSRSAKQVYADMSKPDRLYAIRVLLEKYNTSCARVHGIQRLMYEIKRRPPSEFNDLLDPKEFHRTLEWALAQINVAKSDVATTCVLFPVFLDHALDTMHPLHILENSVMHEVLNRFESAVAIKDPDKKAMYYNTLNDRKVKLLSQNTTIK